MTFQNAGLHGLPGGALAKHEPTKAGDAGDAGQSLDRHDALEKEFEPPPVILPRESQGQRSLVGYTVMRWQSVRHDFSSEHTDTCN